jgi:hypothetical protein
VVHQKAVLIGTSKARDIFDRRGNPSHINVDELALGTMLSEAADEAMAQPTKPAIGERNER